MCEECNWETHLDSAEEMMDNPDFAFANDTVSGIYQWIFENEHVTEAQITALENICGSKK